MRRSLGLVGVLAAAAAGVVLPPPADAQNASAIAGIWTLNRSLSELPRELGFQVPWLPSSSGGASSGSSGSSGGGGRGRRGSGGGGGRSGSETVYAPRESYDDAKRMQLLTAEARNPPARLIVVDNTSTVTFTNELGQSRTLHPDGKEESIEIETVPFQVITRRDGDKLVVTYHVLQGREVRYTYSRAATSSSLAVEVQFLEHGTGDKAVRIYDPGSATETATPVTVSPAANAGRVPAAGVAPDARGRGAPAAAPPSGVPASAAPAVTPGSAESFDARPGAELKGLKRLGILVEDLSAQAVACGLNHDALESAVSKRFTDAGFEVRRNSDEDTYVYVNVMTTSLSSGTCVSRYDAFLYTHATANLSYRDRPVLVQVSLMHRGGIGTSAPAAHAAAVTRGLETYVDLIVSQIQSANR
jgi:hypothetical protein